MSNERPPQPDVVEVDPEGIPEYLSSREIWLAWVYEWVEERDEWAKVPKDGAGGGYRIDATDPQNGVSFETALETYKSGEYSGLGIITDPDSLLVGFDVDDCRDPEQPHETVPDAVTELIDTLDTYVEVSPSETGYRAFALGAKPEGPNRADLPCEPVLEETPHLEVYDGSGGRYLTVTGQHVAGTPEPIETRPQEIKEVYREFIAEDDSDGESESLGEIDDAERPDLDLTDEELLEKARNASNGEKFKRLENGYDGFHGGDTSKADKAFCQMLAFWTGGDRAKIDRLFRSSDRMRGKWSEVHSSGGDTYGEMTIDAALSDQTEYYDPSNAKEADPDPSEIDWDEVERGEAILRTATAPQEPAGELEHQNGVYGYSWVQTDDSGNIVDKGFDTVCNFTLETEAILETYEGDVVSLRVNPDHPREQPYEVKVQPTVFNDARSFREEIVTGRTTYFDPQTHPTQKALRELRQTVGSQDAPIAKGSEYVGLHGDDYGEWVTPSGTLTADGWEENPEFKYYDKNAGNGEMESGIEDKWDLEPEANDEFDPETVREIVERVPWVRKPERGLPVLGWYYAAPVKPLIHDLEGEFNLLQVTGGSGTGKTSTLQTFYELFGAAPDPYDCGSKAFGIEKKLSSSCGLPIWLDEYKPTDLPGGKLKWLHRRLRGLTREQSYSKGTPDQEEITYRMRAPVVFSGEQTVEESAVRRRTVMVNFSDESTSGSYQRTFCELTGATYEDEDGEERAPDGMELDHHALAYYRWLLSKSPAHLEQKWRNAREKTHGAMQSMAVGELDNTEFQGLQTIVFGFELFQEFAESVGADRGELPANTHLESALEHVATNIGPGGRRREHIDEFTELVAQAATEDYIEEGSHYRVFEPRKFETEALAMHMPSTFSAVKRFVRDYNIEDEYTILGKNDYIDNFDDKIEQGSSYPLATTHRVRGLDNGKKTVCIDLERAEELVDGFTRSAFVDEEDDEVDGEGSDSGPDSGGDGVTPLADVHDEMDYITVKATAASVLDPKPWLQAEGTLKSEGALLDYQARGNGNPAASIEQGGVYRIENAKVETDESGTPHLEFRDGTTEVTEINTPQSIESSTPEDDEEQSAEADAVADGGDVELTDVDSETIDQTIREELQFRGSCSIGKLAAALGTKHDHPPDKVTHRVEKLKKRGDVIDHSGGKLDDLTWGAR